MLTTQRLQAALSRRGWENHWERSVRGYLEPSALEHGDLKALGLWSAQRAQIN